MHQQTHTVLLLLAVTRRLLQALDNAAGRGGDGLDGGDTVGDGDLATDAQALVLLGGLGNVVLDLFGRLAAWWGGRSTRTTRRMSACRETVWDAYHTEGTNLLGKGGAGTFTADGADVH